MFSDITHKYWNFSYVEAQEMSWSGWVTLIVRPFLTCTCSIHPGGRGSGDFPATMLPEYENSVIKVVRRLKLCPWSRTGKQWRVKINTKSRLAGWLNTCHSHRTVWKKEKKCIYNDKLNNVNFFFFPSNLNCIFIMRLLVLASFLI